MALKVWKSPIGNEAVLSGVRASIVIELKVTFETVRVSVPDTPLKLAVITVDWFSKTPVASPVALIVATVGLELVQVTLAVMSAVESSE